MDELRMFRKGVLLALVVVVVAVLPVEPAQSQQGGGKSAPRRRSGMEDFDSTGALVKQILLDADKDADQKLSRKEFLALADAWFDRLDREKAGKLSQEQFTRK